MKRNLDAQNVVRPTEWKVKWVCGQGDEGKDEEQKEEFGMRQVKKVQDPRMPTKEEQEEHEKTHLPFRSWCRHCIAGTAKANRHSPNGGMSASEVRVVSLDYAFVEDNNEHDTEQEMVGEESDKDVQYEKDNKDETKANILVIRDAKSRVCTAIPAPQKKGDNEDWSCKET